MYTFSLCDDPEQTDIRGNFCVPYSSAQVRRRNLYAVGEKTHYGQTLEKQINLPGLWEACVEGCDFEARRGEVDRYNAAHKWRKRGLAIVPVKFGIAFTAKLLNQGGALVHCYTDGSVLVSHGGVEMGQGLHTKVQQCVAQAFGIDLAKVHVEETATDKVANSSPSAASMSTDLYAMAALDACRQILERLEPLRRRRRREEEEEEDESSSSAAPDFASLCVAAYVARVNLSAQGFYVVPSDRCGYDFDTQSGTPFNYFTSGVGVSEVELDALTGDVHLRRVDLHMDLGASVNPAIDVGQIEGAYAQGFGLFCLEELVWGDDQHPWVTPGRLFTTGPGAYKIPSANDTPRDFNVVLTDNPNPYAVHSSRAVGEPPLFLGASAFFAVKDAIKHARKEHHNTTSHVTLDAPLTPERARMACGDDIASLFAGPDFRAKGSF